MVDFTRLHPTITSQLVQYVSLHVIKMEINFPELEETIRKFLEGESPHLTYFDSVHGPCRIYRLGNDLCFVVKSDRSMTYFHHVDRTVELQEMIKDACFRQIGQPDS